MTSRFNNFALLGALAILIVFGLSLSGQANLPVDEYGYYQTGNVQITETPVPGQSVPAGYYYLHRAYR